MAGIPLKALKPEEENSFDYQPAPSSPVLSASTSFRATDSATLSPRHVSRVRARRSSGDSRSSTPTGTTPSFHFHLGTPRRPSLSIPPAFYQNPIIIRLFFGLLFISLGVVALLWLTAPNAPSNNHPQHGKVNKEGIWDILKGGGAKGGAKQATILVTGGAGYIGSHTSLLLLEAGFRVVVIDNLSNSKPDAIGRLKKLAGEEKAKSLHFYEADLCHSHALEKIFRKSGPFQAVVHFAGLKAVGESVAVPMRYYENNLLATMNLIDSMAKHGCKSIVFSSSATVYGQPKEVPCTEESDLQPTNPYGRTKLIIEDMLRDVAISDPTWNIILLRYFNPVGAHPSGEIGEDPQGIPNNLMPYMTEVALGLRPFLNVFGTDYNTTDGTGVRDYIHVMDLAAGHIAAVHKINATSELGCVAYNLGTGRGTSVLELHAALEKASGREIALKRVERRPGDASEVYAATGKAERELNWRAERGIDDMCRDQWRWASQCLARLRGQPVMEEAKPSL